MLLRHTDTIASPLNGITHKAETVDKIFHTSEKHKHTLQFNPEAMVGAMAAALPHLTMGSEREHVALKTISKHLDGLPPEKAVDAAYAAAHHTHYLGWYFQKNMARITPSEAETQSRKHLESVAVQDWATQMDRLGEHDPKLWQAKIDEFKGSIQACSLLERTAKALKKPELPAIEQPSAQPERHEAARTNPRHLALAS